MKRAFKPNAAVALQPKAQTKSALLREAQLKDALKKEYSQLQEAVKATEFLIPFVFYSGKNIPGGVCRMKKGDFVWLFLERARKVGAGLIGQGEHTRKDWARISVDDLMVVKGDIIIPHVSLDFQVMLHAWSSAHHDHCSIVTFTISSLTEKSATMDYCSHTPQSPPQRHRNTYYPTAMAHRQPPDSQLVS
jgi:hypothetical protein